MQIELKKLSVTDGTEIYQMLQELPEDENGFLNPMFQKNFAEYTEWLKECAMSAERTDIIDDWKVPQTTYWLFADGEPVGYGKVRHFLTEKLLAAGGTLGYSIRPSARNKGLGTLFLSELIKECPHIGVDRALLTIEKDNIPSVRVALKNGGVIEKSSDTLHYIWIQCSGTSARV